MKYIIEYEKLSSDDNYKYYKYKINDYVYINDIYNLSIDESTQYAKIIGINTINFDNTQVQLPKGYTVWIRDSMIKRKLTSEEIQQYKLEKSVYKYNL